MTGSAIVNPSMGLVIVEGTPKAIKFYKKVMLRRIDWNDEKAAQEAGDDDDDDDSDEDSDDEPAKPAAPAGPPGEAASSAKGKNECHLVWEGEVKERSFPRFKLVVLPTEFAVKDLLEKFGATHYWDIAKQYVPPDAMA